MFPQIVSKNVLNFAFIFNEEINQTNLNDSSKKVLDKNYLGCYCSNISIDQMFSESISCLKYILQLVKYTDLLNYYIFLFN